MSIEREPTVAGIVLAAGDSTRLGRNKLLLELGGETVVRRMVRNAVDAGLAPVCVVSGFEAERVRRALDGLPHEEIVNEEYSRGINRSVQLGIGAVRGRAAAAVVLLADMPLVTSEMIARVVEEYRRAGTPLVVSQYGSVRAPPTLYDRVLFDEFTDAEGEGCGRRVVKAHLHEAASVQMPEQALTDLDNREDLERLQAMMQEATP